jgi:hypothetical protein
VDCRADKVAAVNGKCGSASGKSRASASSMPEEEKCESGTPTQTSETDQYTKQWSRQCKGINGGTSVSCVANKTLGNGVIRLYTTCGDVYSVLV